MKPLSRQEDAGQQPDAKAAPAKSISFGYASAARGSGPAPALLLLKQRCQGLPHPSIGWIGMHALVPEQQDVVGLQHDRQFGHA